MSPNGHEELQCWRPDMPLTPTEQSMLRAVQGAPAIDGLRLDVRGDQQFVQDRGAGMSRAARKRVSAALVAEGKNWLRMQDHRLAEGAFALALRLRLGLQDERSAAVLEVVHELALALFHLDDLRRARSLLEWVVQVREQTPGASAIETQRSIRCLAEVLREVGDHDTALALSQRSFEACMNLLGPGDPDTLDAWNNYGVLVGTVGDLEGARRTLEDALHEARSSVGPDHEKALLIAFSLGKVLFDLDELEAAAALERHVLLVRERELGLEHPLTLATIANLAHTLREMGKVDEARTLFERNRRWQESSHGLAHPATIRTLQQVEALGDEDPKRKLDTASALFDALRKSRGDDHPQTLAAALGLASRKEALGDRAGARALQEDAFKSLERLYGLAHPSTLDAARCLLRTAAAQGDFVSTRSLSLRVLSALLNVRDVGNDAFMAAAACAESWVDEVLATGSPPPGFDAACTRLAGVSRRLCDIRDLRSAEGVRASNEAFTMFHSMWLMLCLRFRPEDCLRALAPLHGMEAWAVIDAEIARRAQPAGHDPVSLASALRSEIVQIRTRISEADARAQERVDIPGMPNDPRETQSLQDLKDEERKALERYRAARDELAGADPLFAAAAPSGDLAVSTIAARLGSNEAVAVLVRPSPEQTVAIVIARDAFDLRELPGLHLVQETLRRLFGRRTEGRVPGARDCLELASKPVDAAGDRRAEGDSDPWMAGWDVLLAMAFWRPLHLAHPAVRHWHIVTGPGIHGLCIDAGRQWGAARYYCGLPAYMRLRDALFVTEASGTFDVVVDPAYTLAPIPFVNTEAQLLRQLHAPGSVVRLASAHAWLVAPSTAQRWHLACHGMVEGKAQHMHGTVLLDAERGVRIDAAAVAGWEELPSEVFLAACLGGIVGSSDSGDAMGIVAALQLRGVRAVIACLAPVSDFYMPLLVAAYESERAGGATPHTALDEAKRKLRSGEWPAVMIDAVRHAYAGQMMEVLQRGDGDPDHDALALLSTVTGWLLPDDVRAEYFAAPASAAGDAARRFARSTWCTGDKGRRALAQRVVQRLVDGRADLPLEAWRAIDHLCACTTCFG